MTSLFHTSSSFVRSFSKLEAFTMSSDSEKPFICPTSGCGQRFANHDHLQTHQARHEFTLKFKGVDALVVDQTPTPTRFLRNCEEAGLFQDLDNPFDQDFHSATTKPNGDTDSEDTNNSIDAFSSAENIANLVTIPVAPPPTLVNPDKPVAMASAPTHVNSTSALTKQKLLQTIQMKEQQKLLEQAISQQLGGSGGGMTSSELLAQALKNISPMSENATTIVTVGDPDDGNFAVPSQPLRRKRGRKPDDDTPEVKRQKFLERNRAAASRCRAKKKVWVEDLEKKSKDITVVNHNLHQEVIMLRSEVQQLKSILVAHKDCPLIVHQVPGGKECSVESEGGNVTLLTQLSNMPSMSPLISSPVPLVGSVVPNISQSSLVTQQQTPEVATDVEICMESSESDSLSERL
ncbi:cyclic AMP-dependent transcription factor ATF-2-like [Halichondria panicea]|uniref:cyclic AMP-dependent transcription factor ATF-2-like n=1 Tax=Halichondria panicea TaxID=6063 RepID=UPI00312B7DC4